MILNSITNAFVSVNEEFFVFADESLDNHFKPRLFVVYVYNLRNLRIKSNRKIHKLRKLYKKCLNFANFTNFKQKVYKT